MLDESARGKKKRMNAKENDLYVQKAIMEEAYGEHRRSNIPRDEDGQLEWALKESLRDTRRSGISYSPLIGASSSNQPLRGDRCNSNTLPLGRASAPHGTRELGSFWWKDILRLYPIYQSITTCKLGDGTSVLFWKDSWGPSVLSHAFHALFGSTTDPKLTVGEVIHAPDLVTVFNLPLSPAASQELALLQNYLSTITYDESECDSRLFQWGNFRYSSQKIYSLAHSGIHVPQTFSRIWAAQCTPQLRFFAWLVVVDRLNTRNMLQRRNYHVPSGTSCVMCNLGREEDIDHLFFTCSFARRVWAKVGIQWNNLVDIHLQLDEARDMSPVKPILWKYSSQQHGNFGN
jgi:hypothetical protein